MQNTDIWPSKFNEEDSNELLDLLDLIQDFFEESKILKWKYAYLQEDLKQIMALYKHANEFIKQQGLEDEYNDWIKSLSY